MFTDEAYSARQLCSNSPRVYIPTLHGSLPCAGRFPLSFLFFFVYIILQRIDQTQEVNHIVKMVAYRIVFLAGAVAALPLNINLGAYSPALVVGKMNVPEESLEESIVSSLRIAPPPSPQPPQKTTQHLQA